MWIAAGVSMALSFVVTAIAVASIRSARESQMQAARVIADERAENERLRLYLRWLGQR